MHIWLKTSERRKMDLRVMKERIDDNHPWVTDDKYDADFFELIIYTLSVTILEPILTTVICMLLNVLWKTTRVNFVRLHNRKRPIDTWRSAHKGMIETPLPLREQTTPNKKEEVLENTTDEQKECVPLSCEQDLQISSRESVENYWLCQDPGEHLLEEQGNDQV